MTAATLVFELLGCAELAGLNDYDVAAGDPLTEEQFASEFATALCKGIEPCCASAGYYHDVQACIIDYRDSFRFQIAPPAGTLDVSYDGLEARHCVAEVSRLMSGCANEATDFDGGPCSNVWRGLQPPGARCEVDAQCTRSAGAYTWCGTQFDTKPGVCMQEPRGRYNDACTTTCSRAPSTESCAPKPRLPRDPRDVSCLPASSEANTRCYTNDNLFCSACGACEGLLVVDMPCSLQSGAPSESGCAPETYCDGEKCRPRVALERPCPLGIECQPAHYCNEAGVCAPKLANGSPCAKDAECNGGCVQGRCAINGAILRLCTIPPQF